MVQLLRLDIDPENLHQDGVNSSDAEERRRTFWVISTFARLSQLGVGADSRRNAESVEYFKQVNSVDQTRCTVRPILYRIDSVIRIAPVVFLHSLAELIFDFGETVQRTLIDFPQKSQSGASSAVLANKQIDSLKEKLSQWILQLPSELRLGVNSASLLSEFGSPCRMVLNLHIYALESFLYRPALYFTCLLPPSRTQNTETVKGGTNLVLETALLKCLEASRNIACIAEAITAKGREICEEFLHAWPAFYEASIVLWFVASRTSNEWLNIAGNHVFEDGSSDSGGTLSDDFCRRGKTNAMRSKASSRVSEMSGVLVDDSDSDEDIYERRSRSVFSALEMSRTGMDLSRSDETRRAFVLNPQSAPALSPIVARRQQLRLLLRNGILETLKILQLFEDNVNFGLRRFEGEFTGATSLNMITPAVKSVQIFLQEIESSLQSARFIGGWISASAEQTSTAACDVKCPGAYLGLLGADVSLDPYGGDASIGRWMCEDEHRWGDFWRSIQLQYFD
ncbi:hypothetical protein HDU83_003243 [Entophlyctis luteolus]|nr:hypothetical protein HDU83_003243 [Entophlyctis luteolus]